MVAFEYMNKYKNRFITNSMARPKRTNLIIGEHGTQIEEMSTGITEEE